MQTPSYMERPPRLPPPPTRPFALPLPRRSRLPNGLEVLHLHRPELPLVHLTLALRSGHTADPARGVGAAFVTAALVDEGAGPRSALEIAGDLQDLGTTLRISVDADSTSLGLDLLAEHLEPALAIVADVVRRPHLASHELERVRAELISRGEDRRADPAQVAGMALAAALFGRSAYGRPALPLPGAAVAMDLPRVERFHARHYRPDNACLAVAGDVSPSALDRIVRRHLGRWQRGPGRARRRTSPPPRGPRLVLVHRAGASESVLRVGHRLPGRRAVDQVATELLNTILGGSFTSRLNLNLRERHGFTYGASSSFSLMRYVGQLSVGAQVERQATVPALQEVLAELDRLSGEPPDREELAKARALVLEDLPATAETLAGLAHEYLERALFREAIDRISRLPVRLAEITPRQLQRAARRLVSPGDATIVVVGDMDSLSGPLERAFGPAQLRDTDGQIVQERGGLSTGHAP